MIKKKGLRKDRTIVDVVKTGEHYIATLGTTKKGYPSFWENGGATKNRGGANLICDRNGNKKTTLFERQRGILANADHALFVVEKNDFLIFCETRNKEVVVLDVFEVKDFGEKEGDTQKVILELFYEFSEENPDSDIPDFLTDVIESAVEKANTYHCKTMMYGEKTTIFFKKNDYKEVRNYKDVNGNTKKQEVVYHDIDGNR